MMEHRKQLRFVVLHHEGIDSPHFDLMFETARESPLTTWRAQHWPIMAPQPIERIGDHRRAYLDFEGELSGDRGRVTRVAWGICSIELHDDGAFWSLAFSNPSIAALHLRQVDGVQWLAVPCCGL